MLYTGKYAGTQYTATGARQPAVRPDRGERAVQCRPGGGGALPATRRVGDLMNDMMQYWLGAYLTVDDAGTTDEGLLDVLGVDTPFTGLDWGFNGADSADEPGPQQLVHHDERHPRPGRYPQFESWVAGRWDREGGPFEPHTGDAYAYSQIGDVSYKRLTNTIDVPAGGATMSFWTSYDTEADWDHLVVEARTVGPGRLDDPARCQREHDRQSTGQSCPAGWRDLHPQLDHYQTLDAERRPAPRPARTGAWCGRSGNSGGWQQWSVDLSALRRQAGRGVHRVRQRLVQPGPGRVRRRHRGVDGPRARRRSRTATPPAGRSPVPRPAARRTRTTSSSRRRRGSPRPRWWRRRVRS